MSRSGLLSLSLSLGLALGSFSLAPAVSALTLTKTPIKTSDWTNLGWKVEGRAGADPQAGSRDDDYEIAIGPNGAQADLVAQQNWLWQNGQTVNWNLNWNGSTAEFKFDGLPPIAYTPAVTTGLFNGLSLFTQVLTNDGKVQPGTALNLLVTTVNGQAVTDQAAQPVFSNSVGPAINQAFYTSNVAIQSLAGTVNLSWPSGFNPQTASARSRVDFQIQGYTVGQPPVDVPEPTATLGLLALGAVGAMAVRQRNRTV